MRRAWLGLFIVALIALVGCQQVLAPLDQQAARQAEEGATELTLVRIAVCWEALPLVEDLAADQVISDPRLSFDIIPVDSPIALDLVMAGQADLAIVGEQPGSGLLAGADATSLAQLRPRVIALDAIGVVAPTAMTLDGLTTAQFAALFAGRIMDWSTLEAGSGQPVLVSREAQAVTRRLVEEELLSGQPVSSAAVVMPHEHGIIEYVAEHPSAIGYASMAYADPRIKRLALDGVSPDTRNIQRGVYPLVHPLVLLVNPQATGATARLAAYLTSGKGRDLIKERYTLP